jgi:hypothetical protein
MAENNSRIAVPSFATQRIVNKDDKSLNIQFYDLDNFYPQRVRNAINSSGTGTSCTNLFAKFLRGRGFRNKELDDMIVNSKNEKLSDIHRLLSKDRALYLGYCYHITYNALLEPIEIKYVPFEYVRLCIPDDTGAVAEAKVYEDWAREFQALKRDSIMTIDLFTTDESKMLEQIEKAGGFDKWNGHLYYFSESGYLNYPPAVCDSVFEDVLTDAGIKMWKFRGISTDFMANYFWIINGEFADDTERQDYVNSINSFQGVDSSHKVILVECPVPNSKPELVKVDKQDNDKVYELTEVTVRENIIRCYGQPLTLHAIKTSGQLGLSKEFEEAKLNYDETTNDARNQLGDCFIQVLERWYTGNPAKDGDYLVVPITGIDEQKTIKPISETLEVGKLTTMQMIITDTSMSVGQKINFLVAVYGIDINIATAIVNGTALPQGIK